jgi:hypothetical protein
LNQTYFSPNQQVEREEKDEDELSTKEIERRMLSTGHRLTQIVRRRKPLRLLPTPSTSSSKEKPFPQRAFVMNLEGDFRVVEKELRRRGVEVVRIMSDPDHDFGFREEMSKYTLDEGDLIVAIPAFTRYAMKTMRIRVPDPPDYPSCLRDLLHRKIHRSTLGALRSLSNEKLSKMYMKPALDAKLFNGLIPSKDWLDILIHRYGSSISVYCSEIVDIVGEYGVYVVNAGIRSIVHYGCKSSVCKCVGIAGTKNGVDPDLDVIEDAVRRLASSDEGRDLSCGYRADFAVIRIPTSKDDCDVFRYATCLIEVNDAYVAGMYAGVSEKDFVDMHIERFRSFHRRHHFTT